MWRLSLKQQDCQKTQLRIYKSKGKILQAAFATKADAAFCFSPIGVKGKVDFPQIGFEKGTTERGFSKVSKSV